MAINHFRAIRKLGYRDETGVNWAGALQAHERKGGIKMSLASGRCIALGLVLSTLAAWPLRAAGQICQTAGELDDPTRSAITAAGLHDFDLAAKGDVASLRQGAIPSLAAAFDKAEAVIKNHQQDFAAAHASVKSMFLLEADGSAPLPQAEFDCGVFGKNGQTSGSAVFSMGNLPPGKYAVVLLDATSPKARTSFSVILQQAGSDWKLADLYVEPSAVAGHDSEWFAGRAREYKAKGQMHNAWLFLLQARSLNSPIPFMSTLATDKLYDESQSLQPPDFPFAGKTADLTAGTSTYKLTAIFPQAVGDDLNLIVRYQADDVSNTNHAYQINVAVIKALVAKYPELRDAFAGVVARAVDPSGRDYGTLLAMKDIK
jgi:hypothetical protein